MFKEEKLIWDITNRPIKGPDDDSGTLPQSAEIGAVSDAKLTPLVDDFRGMKPGLAIYIASPTKYAAMGIDIKPGTSGKVHVKKDTDRHWVMWDGVGFTDNHGAARSLGDLKRLVGGKGRIIVNVHDPLGQYGAYV